MHLLVAGAVVAWCGSGPADLRIVRRCRDPPEFSAVQMHYDNDNFQEIEHTLHGIVVRANGISVGLCPVKPDGVDVNNGLAGGDVQLLTSSSSSLESSDSASEAYADRTVMDDQHGQLLDDRVLDEDASYGVDSLSMWVQDSVEFAVEQCTIEAQREMREDWLLPASDFGVDVNNGLAGGESQLLTSSSSLLESSDSASEAYADRAGFADGTEESIAMYDAEWDLLHDHVERYVLSQAGLAVSASREDRNKALDAAGFWDANKFGDSHPGWASDQIEGRPYFISSVASGQWSACMSDAGEFVLLRRGRRAPSGRALRRGRAARAAAARQRPALAAVAEEVRGAHAEERSAASVEELRVEERRAVRLGLGAVTDVFAGVTLD